MGRPPGPQQNENEKIIGWVRKFKANQDDESFEQIVKVLNSYLRHLSEKKYRIAGNSSDDVYQEGLFALSTKAIPDYDEEKGAFLSFAKLCIRRHIITVLKSVNNNKNKALNGSVSLDSTGQDKDEGPLPVSELMADKKVEDVVECISRAELHKRLKANLEDKLTKLEKEVLGYYLQNMSYIEIVQAMNKHRRGRNRVDTKCVDNAIVRSRSKAFLLEKEEVDKNPAK